MLNQLAPLPSPAFALPALVASADDRAQLRFLEFFAVTIRNPHTRRAYARAAGDFLAWVAARGVTSLAGVQPLHVAAWVERLGREVSVPTVKQRLAGVRHLFDWLVTGQVMPTNPAASVRGPAHSVRRGKTPVLAPDEARRLLDSIDLGTDAGLRDRALIALMVYSFARIGAALSMRVEDVFMQNRRLWVRLHEKGGKRHEMPCHHNLEEYLTAYIDGYSFPKFFVKIFMPLIASGIGVAAFFCFMFSWVELLLARTLTTTAAKPIAATMTRTVSASGMDWGVLAAAGVLTIVPGALVIYFVRNYIAKGFALGRV